MLLAGVLVLTLLLFQSYVLAPRDAVMRDEIQSRYVTLQKYETYMEGSAITETDIKSAMRDLENVEKRLIVEKSEFLASARMQRDLSDMLRQSGIAVQTMRPMNIEKTKNFISVPVYFEGSGTIRQIGDFLKAVDSSQIMLKVDKMTVNVTNMQNPRELRVKMQLSGLSRP